MESVHYFVRGLFRGMPENDNIAEQREELEAHINDRISDSIAQGVSQDRAFSEAVASLGNLDELIETMTGEKKKIFSKKADWFMMAGATVYGTIYMIAVGVWFAYHDFGLSAIYIALPGWLGFAIPTLIQFIDYRNHPFETEVVPIDRKTEVRASFIGWVLIAGLCWLANFMFLGTDTFLHVIWAWMPMFGILSWPLMQMGYSWMIRNLKSLEPQGLLH